MDKPEWQDRDYREAYLEASIEQGIAWQIKINRQKRGITQDNLAKALGISLPMLQELEDPEIGGYSLETLVKVAKVFDCALSVKFIPYSELADDSQNLSEDAQYAVPYSDHLNQGECKDAVNREHGFVIKYVDGYYDLYLGHPARKSEATRYPTYGEAEAIAKDALVFATSEEAADPKAFGFLVDCIEEV